MSNSIEERAKGKIFMVRMYFLLFIQFLCCCILIARYVYLQIMEFDSFKSKSENNNIKYVPIISARGDFLDRNNTRLTNNKDSYNLILYTSKNDNSNNREIQKIVNLLDLSDFKRKKVERQIKQNKGRKNIQILDNLTWDELTIFESNFYKLNNLNIEESYTREYLYPEEFAHLIGYIGTPSGREVVKLSMKNIQKDILLNPNFKIGKNGFEASFNELLIGKNGYKKLEVNANNNPVREIEKIEPEVAEDIKLTINLEAQKFIYKRIKDLRAAVVVMDVKTGEIISMVSAPSYDANKVMEGVDDNYWNELINNYKKPLYNRTISALYSPGSTFKLAVALASLENRELINFNPLQNYNCIGEVKIGKVPMRCWKKKGHGKLDLMGAIEQSCNTYFITLGTTIGNEPIYEVAKKLGLGEKFNNLNFLEIKNGILPNNSWKRRLYKSNWMKGDTANSSIGQGFLLATPLQLAVFVSRIANNGFPIKPVLFYEDKKTIKYNETVLEKEPMFKSENLAIVKEGMFRVVNGKNGTVSRIYLRDKAKYKIAGKTGTSQVIATNFKEEMEKVDNLKEEFRNHGIFVGFAPFDSPKYGMAVVIEHGGGGSIAAAPVALDIFKYLADEDI